MDLEFKHPLTEELIASRNSLLQRTMRPASPLFSIAEEYPIVLDASSSRLSFCFTRGNQVFAHANLWPRRVISANSALVTTVGLVGNVATDTSMQGQGVMTKLMIQLQNAATEAGMSHLILWSDLDSFYQKRGFTSLGRERRLFFARQALAPYFDRQRFVCIDPSSCKDQDLEGFLRARPKLPLTLERTVEEFRLQLSIPGTSLIYDTALDCGFAILGKGYDMGGIIHEWGSVSPHDLMALLAWTAEIFHLTEIGLLVPGEAAPLWNDELSKVAARSEEWPMALAKSVVESPPHIDRLFVWGLDAI